MCLLVSVSEEGRRVRISSRIGVQRWYRQKNCGKKELKGWHGGWDISVEEKKEFG